MIQFQNLAAKKLATILGAGEGKISVGVSWPDLSGKCLVIMRSNACDDNTEEEEDDVAASYRAAEIDRSGILRSAGLTRTFSSISLSGFNILSSGSSSKSHNNHIHLLYLINCQVPSL